PGTATARGGSPGGSNRRASTPRAGPAAPARPTAARPLAGASASSEKNATTTPASTALAGLPPHSACHGPLSRAVRWFSETFVRLSDPTARYPEEVAMPGLRESLGPLVGHRGRGPRPSRRSWDAPRTVGGRSADGCGCPTVRP